MPIGGETIGRAYIRILADGRGLDESIRKEMHDAEPAIEVAGREHEKAYSKAYNDQLAKDKNFEKSYRRSLDKAFGNMSARAKLLSGNIQQNIANAIGEGFDFGMDVPVGITPDPDMDRRAKLIGERAGANIAEGLNEGMDPKKIDFGREIRRAIKQVDADLQNDLVRDWRRGFNEINDITNKITGNIRRDFIDAGTAIRDSREAIREFGQVSRTVDRARIAVDKMGGAWKRRFKEFTDGTDRFANSAGRMFGAGSRNNFFNLFGKGITGIVGFLPGLIKGIVGIGEAAVGVAKQIGEPIGRIVSAFQDGATTAEKWGAGLSQALAETVAMGPAAAIVLAGVAAASLLIAGAIGAVVGAVSALAGALTGLAATVGFGLVGILGFAAAALIPLAAAIGGVALAIHSVKGMEEITKQIKPLKATLDDLGKVIAKEAFANIGGNLERANTALKAMEPLAKAVGDGLAKMFDGFVKGLNSPTWIKFRDNLTTFLPGAMASLGRSISNIFGGVAGIFRALTTNIGGSKSIAQLFLDTIERVTGRFDNWVNSVKGQDSVREFFTKAYLSAQQLGHFIQSAIDLIGSLLSAARPTGDTLFSSMTDQMEAWSIWLNDPAHAGEIAKWFGDARQTAMEVGSAIKGILTLIDNIDTPTNRKLGEAIFSSFVLFANLASLGVKSIGVELGFVLQSVHLVLQAMRPLFFLIAHTPGNPLRGLAAGMVKGIDAVDGFIKKFQNVRKEIDQTSAKKVDINTAPAVAKLGYVVKTAKDGKQRVEHLDGSKVDVNTAKAVLALQKVYDKAIVAKNKVDANDGNKVQINTQQAQNALGLVTSEAHRAKESVLGVDGLYVNVNTSSAQASLNQLSHTADVVASKLSRGSQATMAAGGLVVGPTRALIGEAGPEAIVPLNRPLYLVDPAVRALSAIAQGLTPMAAGGVTPGKVTNVGGITIVTPTKDPAAVAQETVNRLVGVGY